MTIAGWGIFALIAVFIIGIGAFIGICTDKPGGIAVGAVIGTVLSTFVLMGMLWYFNNTAAGSRALKSQQSNFSGGIDRIVRVYDMSGGLIQQYDGRFDVDYDENRIIFDDENGKRHVIYYPTGTVIIDEK